MSVPTLAYLLPLPVLDRLCGVGADPLRLLGRSPMLAILTTKELLGRLAAEDCFQVGVKFQGLTCAHDNIGQVRV